MLRLGATSTTGLNLVVHGLPLNPGPGHVAITCKHVRLGATYTTGFTTRGAMRLGATYITGIKWQAQKKPAEAG